MTAVTDRQRFRRLRLFLAALSALLFVGTVAELLSVKHYGDRVQLIPFAMCGIGFGLVLLSWWNPSPGMVKGTRAVMALIALSSLIGVYEHIQGNLGFAREVHPHASTTALLKSALTGRDPLMAPGILAVAAILAIAATFAVPAQAPQSLTPLPSLTERREQERQPLASN